MECRICNQPITFVRGHHPDGKRKSTRAVHDSELSAALARSNGEIVRPHPGAQRRLRIEMESKHQQSQAAAQTPAQAQTMTASVGQSRPAAEPAASSSPADETRPHSSLAEHHQQPETSDQRHAESADPWQRISD